MRASFYVSSPATAVRHSRFRVFPALMCAFLMILVSLSGVFIMFAGGSKEASALDPIRTTMCYHGEDSDGGMVYQYTNSDDLAFYLRSKSIITPGVNDVDGGFNGIIGVVGGHDFEETNEKILGTHLANKYHVPKEDEKKDSPSSAPTDSGEKNYAGQPYPENFNQGPRVNPYDRFGVQGFHYTAYNGEWNYALVKACEGSDPLPSGLGMFYEDRLEPASTWDEVNRSGDPRSRIFTKPAVGNYMMGFATMLSNFFFWWNKLFVVLTLAFIEFAFSDLVKLMNLTEIVGSTNKGFFATFMNTIYYPLMVFVSLIVGVKVIWYGLAKRQYRHAMGNFLASIGMVVLAAIIATKPAEFIALPNNVAIQGQAIVVGALSTGTAGGTGLCETNVADDKVEGSGPQAELAKTSKNMRSTVSCMMWKSFILRPYLVGQFGKDYNELFAKGTKDSTRNGDSKELQNTNEKWVGDAAVPMGNGEFIYNWGLFNVSTNTNAHAPLAHPGELSKYTNGAANDWWRIVDALSNYSEVEKEETRGIGANTGDYTVVEPAPDIQPLEPWADWTGRSMVLRLVTSFFSLLMSMIGLAAPAVFAVLTAGYAIGSTIMMIFAPIMLFFGAWGGSGFRVFKQWAMSIFELILKRVLTGLLLALSLVFTVAGIKLLDDVGWVPGFVVIVICSIVLIVLRHKIMDAIAAGLGTKSGFSAVAGKVADTFKTGGRDTVNTLGATVLAGARTKNAGGKFSEGARLGLKNSTKDLARRSRHSRDLMLAYESGKRNVRKTDVSRMEDTQKVCTKCGSPIENSMGRAYQNNKDGLFLCPSCYDDASIADVRNYSAVELGENKEKKAKVDPAEEQARARQVVTDNTANAFKQQLDKMSGDRPAGKKLTQEEYNKLYVRGMDPVLKNLDKHREFDKNGTNIGKLSDKDLSGFGGLANVPQGLEELVTVGGLDVSTIKELEKQGEFNAIQDMYANAFSRLISTKFELRVEEVLEDVVLHIDEWEQKKHAEENATGTTELNEKESVNREVEDSGSKEKLKETSGVKSSDSERTKDSSEQSPEKQADKTKD